MIIDYKEQVLCCVHFMHTLWLPPVFTHLVSCYPDSNTPSTSQNRSTSTLPFHCVSLHPHSSFPGYIAVNLPNHFPAGTFSPASLVNLACLTNPCRWVAGQKCTPTHDSKSHVDYYKWRAIMPFLSSIQSPTHLGDSHISSPCSLLAGDLSSYSNKIKFSNTDNICDLDMRIFYSVLRLKLNHSEFKREQKKRNWRQ